MRLFDTVSVILLFNSAQNIWLSKYCIFKKENDIITHCGLRETGVHKKRGGAQNNSEGLTDLYIDDRYSIYNKRLITKDRY